MSIQVALYHKTAYKYDRKIRLGPQTIRLRPSPHCRTTIVSYSLKILPKGHFINWLQDPTGDHWARVVFPEPVNEFHVEVDLIADIKPINPFDFFIEESAEKFPFQYSAELSAELQPFLIPEESNEILSKYMTSIDKTSVPTIDFLSILNQKLASDIRYVIRHEPGVQTTTETLELSSGSCRDSAYLLVQILRHLGFAARFVSGYLIQLTPDVRNSETDGPKEDFCDLHAWTEVYIPGAGWVGLDPTSGLFAAEGHIPLSSSPTPAGAAAISGMVEPSEATLDFQMHVSRLRENPRHAKPYTEAEWQAIESIATQVDNDLRIHNCNLTMGAEPTFVSTENRDDPQWTYDALGEEKYEKACQLVYGLKEKFAPDGLLMHAQGKWYPGEPLPRWAIYVLYRKDGIPLWRNQNYLAKMSDDLSFHREDAHEFANTLAKRLHLSSNHIVACYEDIYYEMWQQGNLPATDVAPNDLLAAYSDPVGYCLPLYHDFSSWKSSDWTFRRGKLFLLPGTSPVGYRLPLDRIGETENQVAESHPFQPLEKIVMPETKNGNGQTHSKVRTALCVQIREGKLYVFLPPVSALYQWLELIEAIEDTAMQVGKPVILEGYVFSKDYRIEQFSASADPGVVELNVQPTQTWGQLKDLVLSYFSQAQASGLTAEKYTLDGKQTGTGGGNHIVLGGPTPSTSPFFRKPELLRSFVSYFQTHPSLSYFFSGMFIGPTSQSPRIDEARIESLYEIEVAFSEMGRQQDFKPWMLDRIFRNHLVDLTGNAHRTELCIDKMHSPDNLSGRRGLLEMRNFEMSPHPQMNLLQFLLVRSLFLMFWKNPVTLPLIRFDSSLHDKFMLPTFLKQDLSTVLEDLSSSGYPLSLTWFEPFYEFRFPLIGRTNIAGFDMELRTALEPWKVLGEEMFSGGTARGVDSSTERIQISLGGNWRDRYVLVCNGRRVPLKQADTGLFVGAVRFKAWNPPSTLHPTIPATKELTFDILDLWNDRSIGGCVYYVSHPGGRSYDTMPVNVLEAAGRVLSRFKSGHTPGVSLPLPPQERNPEYPFTLDLRKSPLY